MYDVHVRGTIERVGPRTVRTDDRERVILEGILADATGEIAFLAWHNLDCDPGTTLDIRHASMITWNDRLTLELDRDAVVVLLDHAPKGSSGTIDLSDVTSGETAIEVRGRVLDVESTTVTSRGSRCRIQRGVIGDGTARLPFTDWCARSGIEQGRDLRFVNTYVASFRGFPTINLGTYASIHPASVHDIAPVPTRQSLEAIDDKHGSVDVLVEGTILEILDGSGIIRRCPICRRVVERNSCRAHGRIDPTVELRTRAILDDGTGSATLILNSSITASIYEGGLEGARKEAEDSMKQEVVADRISDRIVGRPFRIRGQVRSTGDRPTVTATTFMSRPTSAHACLREVRA